MAGQGGIRRLLIGGVATLCVALSACAPAADYAAPSFPFLDRYRAASAEPPVLLSNLAWWERLDDPVLDRLVTLALQGNLSLAIARERVTEAQAARARVPGAALLSSSATARAEGTGSTGPDLAGTIDLGLSWILDPWGGRTAELTAAGARIDAADAEVDAAELLVLLNLSNAYLDLRYRQRLLALARAELSAREETLALTRRLEDAGEATALEITRSRARVAEIRADLPGATAAVAAALNQISVLAGAAPGTLPSDLEAQLLAVAAQPIPSLSPEIGIPADLLRNRPDIRIAERRYAAAIADIGAARAALYPRLSLTGAITLDAFDGGLDYFFGPALQFPTLPTADARAAVTERHSQARQAYDAWRQTVLNALLEVENALVDYDAVTASTAAAADAARLHREARNLTLQVYEVSEATLGDLIDAEEAISAAERRLTQLRLDRAQAFVALNVRLGAGHDAEDAADRR